MDVWVSIWKHGPADVFDSLEAAKNWNVCAPRMIIWEEVADGAWSGSLLDTPWKGSVRIFKRTVRHD